MIALYAVLVVVVVAAFVGMFPLRRAADRSWRRHQLLRPLAKDLARIQIVVVDRLTPALRQLGAAMAEMAPAAERFAKALREAEKK